MTRRAWAYFAGVAVLWGIPYLFIKVAVDGGLHPVFLAWARVTLGAVLLVAVAHRAGLLGSLRGRWRWVAAYAVIEICLPFPLIGFGEERVSSALAAIIIAAVPLVVAVLALRFEPSERVTGMRAVGLAVGFAGVVALMGIDVSGSTRELVGALAVLAAAVGYAIGPMLLRRGLPDLDPRAVMAGALVVAAVVLAPAAALTIPDQRPEADALASVAVLGVFCTAAAFVLFGYLLGAVGVSRASVITYVAPLVAVVAGMLVLDERPGPGAIAGLVLILAGSWLSTGGTLPGRWRRRPVPAP